MKKALLIFMSAATLFLFSACSGGGGAEISDFTGQWKQANSNSDTNYQGAYIESETIEIYWFNEEVDSKSLYWAGSYIAPENAVNEYTWDSVNDTEKTSGALLASSADTKTFTYKDGELSYEASALGTTTTIKLKPYQPQE